MRGEIVRISTLQVEAQNRIVTVKEAMATKFGGLEQFCMSSGPRPGGGPRLRVPDPAGWKLRVFEGRDDGFHKWREAFDLQVGSIWIGMDVILEGLRDRKEAVTRESYEAAFAEVDVPSGSNPADWDYAFVSRKLFMVLHNYMAIDPQKVIAEAEGKCGLEAYRLLNKEYDPLSADMTYNLLERVFVIAKWSVKGIAEEHAALREAKSRMRQLEKRSPISLETRKMVAGMLYSNVLSPETKEFISGKAATLIAAEAGGEPVLTLPRDDFELMRAAVEERFKIKEKQRPVKMDLDAFYARQEQEDEESDSHAE